MIVTYTIQNIPSGNIILADAVQTTNKTEFIHFLNTIDELQLQGGAKGENCLFFLQDAKEVFFERHIDGLSAANIVKDRILDFIASGALRFDTQTMNG